MTLKSITLQNFRCYEEETIHFQPELTLITGENDGGKTALLTAVSLLMDRKAMPNASDFRRKASGGAVRTMSVEGILVEKGEEVCVRRRFKLKGDVATEGTLEITPTLRREKLLEAQQAWGSDDWTADDGKEVLKHAGMKPESRKENRKKQFDKLVEASEGEGELWVEAMPIRG